MADDVAARSDQFAGGLGEWLALLLKICGEKLLVISSRDETDFLGVGLFGEGQALVRAISRTSGLVRRPRGNSVWASCSWVRPKRK